ncbi:hypothetical protein [Marmoricola sp. RAF53]|uniref:hypothetical protein n=1 Tax=Marmoricola sp. RAF53 TaxID=3233059 RepID=UPI003F9CCDC8
MKEDIEQRLAELREAVESARSVPMSASVMFNRSDFLELVDRLQEAVNATLAEASEVVEDRDAFVDTGRLEAIEILREAERKQADLVSDTDVYKLAQARAAEVEAEAQQAAAELRVEADQYVEAKLANFEHTLEKTLDLVRRGRAQLTGGHVHGLGDDSDVADITLSEHLDR